jgi:proteic killer suppression protein
MSIRTFRCAETEALFEDERPRSFHGIETVAVRKLQMLNDAVELRDLAALPGNRLEALKGERKGQHSIRINDQWRLCFTWTPEGVINVEIVDYH